MESRFGNRRADRLFQRIKTMRLAKFLSVFIAAIALGIAAAPAPAHAWGRIGVFVGFPPVVIGDPFYGPGPIYDLPPPVYDAPPAYPPVANAAPAYTPSADHAPYGTSCYAKPYICPLERERKVGRPCACEALGGGVAAGTVQ
jgi:hypothetical protein